MQKVAFCSSRASIFKNIKEVWSEKLIRHFKNQKFSFSTSSKFLLDRKQIV